MPTLYEFEKGFVSTTKRAALALFDALMPFAENEIGDHNDAGPVAGPSFWPSTIAPLDDLIGGFYGLTVLTAEKGTGKSTLALASALEAAGTHEWEVVYLAAEDDWDTFRERFGRYIAAHPDLDPWDTFHVLSVGRGQTPRSLAASIAAAIDVTADRRVLVVLDSINSIVNLGSGNYFTALRDFGLWAMSSRRATQGDVSWLIISEANSKGNAKGEALPYWADVSIKLVKKTDHVVEIIIDKSRRTAGEGTLGLFARKVMRGTFEQDPGGYEPFKPRVVGGDEQPW